MKIAYLHQYFATPAGTTGTRTYEVGRHMVAAGHSVTVICGSVAGNGLPPLAPHQPWRVDRVEGMKVVILNLPYANRMSVRQRVVVFFGYAVGATVATLVEPDLDLVFGTSTPLTVAIPTRVAARLRRLPYVFEVRDLWPEDLVAAGRMSAGPGLRFFEFLERFAYEKANKILLVSKGFEDRLRERGLPAERLSTIVLGGDGSLFETVVPDPAWFEQRGLATKWKAVYSGAHGDANGLTQLLDAAEHLRDRPDIAIILIGEGGARPGLLEAVRARGLTNVHLFESVPKGQIVRILAAADAGLMILKQITRPRWVTPNKLFDYMFAGLPVLVNFAGTTADLVQELGVGVATAPGSAVALAEQLRRWADDPESARALGRRGKEIAFGRFDRRPIAEAMLRVFEAAIAEGPR